MEINMKKINLFLIAFLILLFSACSGAAPESITGEWTLISFGDSSNLTPAVPNVETSIAFDENGQFGGTVGCNSFGAGYKLENDQLVFEPIISTMMFCEETSPQESAVLAILSDATVKFQLNGGQLTLTSADGASVVVLERK